MAVLPRGGWYPDPSDPAALRYWDGQRWTGDARHAPTPGWYTDPADPSAVRYWSGRKWTGSVGPAPPPTTGPPPDPAHEPAAVGVGAPSSLDDSARAGAWQPAPAAGPVAAPPAPVVAAPEPEPAAADPSSRPAPTRRVEPRVIVLAAVVVVALVVVGYLVVGRGRGSSSTATAPPVPATVPSGYHLVTVPSAGLSLAVRDGWLQLDPSSPTLRQAEEQIASVNPQLASSLAGFGSSTSAIKFLAVDVGGRPYGSNVEVQALGVSKAALTDPIGARIAFSKQLPDAAVIPTTIDGTRGLSVSGSFGLTLPTGARVTVYATGYMVGTPAGVQLVTFGTADAGRRNADVQTGLRTLRIAP